MISALISSFINSISMNISILQVFNKWGLLTWDKFPKMRLLDQRMFDFWYWSQHCFQIYCVLAMQSFEDIYQHGTF